MSSNVRNVFVLAGMLTVYGFVLWLYESRAFVEWTDTFVASSKARFAHDQRETLIREEMMPMEEPTDASD